MRHWRYTVFYFLILSVYPLSANKICLVILAEEGAKFKNFEKLVHTEMLSHPAYQIDSTNCESRLKAEVFPLAGAYNLTVQITGQVPLRYTFERGSELPGLLRNAISLVLDNDPVRLKRDISHYSKASLAVHNLRVRGTNLARLELFQNFTKIGSEVTIIPGGAVSFTRGADHWQVFGKCHGGFLIDKPVYNPAVLRFVMGIDIGVAYDLNSKKSHTPYIGVGAGVQHLYFEGHGENSGKKTSLRKTGPTLTIRAGYRFFRVNDFDFDIFLSSYLPLFISKNDKSDLFGKNGRYTPSLQIGLGIGL